MDDRTCAYAPCVNVFSPQRKDRRFCSQKCARLAWYFSNHEHANAMNRRYVKANRERLNQRKAQWWRADPDRARVLAHRARLKRRYRLKAQFIEDVVLSVLAARDGGRCQLCGKTVRATTGERGPSIDHIVPLSLGGDHSYANTQLAHLSCNKSKNARALKSGEQLRLIG